MSKKAPIIPTSDWDPSLFNRSGVRNIVIAHVMEVSQNTVVGWKKGRSRPCKLLTKKATILTRALQNALSDGALPIPTKSHTNASGQTLLVVLKYMKAVKEGT